MFRFTITFALCLRTVDKAHGQGHSQMQGWTQLWPHLWPLIMRMNPHGNNCGAGLKLLPHLWPHIRKTPPIIGLYQQLWFLQLLGPVLGRSGWIGLGFSTWSCDCQVRRWSSAARSKSTAWMVYRASSPICSSKGSRITVYDWRRVCTMDSEETFMQLPGHLEVCKNWPRLRSQACSQTKLKRVL